MIKFENTEVFNFEGALRGMRNPLNSWDKADSFVCNKDAIRARRECGCGCKYYGDTRLEDGDCFCLGKNDLALAQRLIKAGSDHRKFLRQIFVSVDITAPLYWWKEFDTYKVATVANSCSTMHKIHAKEFTLDDFSHEHLTHYCNDGELCRDWLGDLEDLIWDLNFAREKFIETKDKKYWWQMIQLLPTSYNQKRTVTLNYETLRNIYGSRRNHKLDEWSVGFMEWIDSLPYADELIKY